MTQINLPMRQKQTHRLRLPRGEAQERDGCGVWDQQTEAIIYGMDKQQGPTDSTGNYIQYSVINHNGKEYEKECMICIYKLNHSAVQQKLTQHCKSTIFE